MNAYVLYSNIYISFTEYSSKLKFSWQTYLTHRNIIFEYCYASVILDNVDNLFLKDVNLFMPVLKTNTATMLFFSKKLFLVSYVFHLVGKTTDFKHYITRKYPIDCIKIEKLLNTTVALRTQFECYDT